MTGSLDLPVHTHLVSIIEKEKSFFNQNQEVQSEQHKKKSGCKGAELNCWR